MPKISDKNKEKIQEQILHHLYTIFPRQIFTADIAKELIRDEEFIKSLLLDLEKKGLITKINLNPKGIPYKIRLRWRLSNKVQKAYKQSQ